MVRLKGERRDDELTVYTNFNSTMVRLKEDHYSGLLYYVALFQFHYGTIKRTPFNPLFQGI